LGGDSQKNGGGGNKKKGSLLRGQARMGGKKEKRGKAVCLTTKHHIPNRFEGKRGKLGKAQRHD